VMDGNFFEFFHGFNSLVVVLKQQIILDLIFTLYLPDHELRISVTLQLRRA